ncbi:MAG: 30S ribosomal protein S9, partial [Candidatus Odinarchaeia archaeon]
MVKVLLTSGKRKSAIARATIKEGKGKIRINSLALEVYGTPLIREKIKEPLYIAGEKLVKKLDI